MSALTRLAIWLGLASEPAPATPAPIVHRGEREISAGAAGVGAPATPPAKLSAEDAERLFGIPVRIHGR